MVSDDGIVVRVPDSDDGGWGVISDSIAIEPDEVEDLVVGALASSVMFSARFRECAARALLLPRRRPGGRTPLWQQRQRAADLLKVASRYGSFPILLETYRECLRDVFDVPALTDLLRAVASRRVRIVQVETPFASPFASSLQFDYVANYLYEGDAPLAERRASALTLDRELLAELLGADELRDLIEPAVLADLELELQRLAPERHARSLDGVADLLREIGDLRADEVAGRTDGPAARWLAELEAARRVYRLRVAGEDRWAAAEDAARFRDGLGVPVPSGLPGAFVTPVDRPLLDLVARYARTHGPFVASDVTARLGVPVDAAELALAALDREGRVVAGSFRPGGGGGGGGGGVRRRASAAGGGDPVWVAREWCDAEVLRRLRRRSLAALRREVEPVDPVALVRFLPAWHRVGAAAAGNVERTFDAISQLQGAALPASALESDVLPARLSSYVPAWLDELCGTGEVVWIGRGPLGSDDGRVSLYLREQAPALAPAPVKPHDEEWWSPVHARLFDHLEARGASFWPALYQAAGGGDERTVADALWDLVWAGVVTNDSMAPLRAFLGGSAPLTRSRGGRRPRPGRVTSRAGPARAAGRWSLVADLLVPDVPPTERAAVLAAQLLDRHGIVTRDAAVAEDVPGGFSAVYQVLKAMEEAGRARRGYFVEGLGGAQFALPGAVDRLRAHREPEDAGAAGGIVLAAADPANPFGAAIGWPEHPGSHRPRRAAGARVALVDGELVAYLERGGRTALAFTADEDSLAAAASALAGLVDSRRVSRLMIERVDGEAPATQPLAAALRAVGFVDHPRGLVRR
jgi:ATP-dependent Lhr-like helicase